MHTKHQATYLELVEADEFEAILSGRTPRGEAGQRPRHLAAVTQALRRELTEAPVLAASSRLRIRNRLLRDVAAARASMRARLGDALYRRAQRVLSSVRAGAASGLATVVALVLGSGLVVQEAAAL